MRYLCLFLLSLILIYLSGCGGGGTTTPSYNNPPPPPYNIYGTVEDKGGRPISGVTVSVHYEGDTQELDSKQTDSEGKYYLWVPFSSGKTYVITATKPGYQTQSTNKTLPSPDSQIEVNFQLQPSSG
ncbi:MAG: carboxypeptidase-like regulatory domain-containing protein [bacterium]